MIFSNRCNFKYNFFKFFWGLCLVGFLVSCAGKGLPGLAPLGGAYLSPVRVAEFSDDGKFLFTLAVDGQVRVWDIGAGSGAAGKQIRASRAGIDVMPGGNAGAGRFGISINGDGSVGLLGGAKGKAGKELVRFYSFGHDETDQEWISIAGTGYYAASPGGGALIAVRAGEESFGLNQFSEVLHRPDMIINAMGEGKGPAAGVLADLLRKRHRPPLVTILDSGGGVIRVKVTEQKGGLGVLALYRRNGRGQDVLEGLIDIAEKAEKKYKEKGKTCYELRVNIGGPLGFFSNTNLILVSAFNRQHTVESERRGAGQAIPGEAASAGTDGGLNSNAAPQAETGMRVKPALYVLIAALGDGQAPAYTDALGELFSRQETGSLYSKVELRHSQKADRQGFKAAFDEIASRAAPEDTFVCYLSGSPGIDGKGDFVWKGEQNISKQDLLENILKIKNRHTLVLLNADAGPAAQAAFDRLRERLSGQGVLGIPAELLAKLPAVQDSPSDSTGRYISAGFFLSYAVQGRPGGVLAGFPAEDFMLLDRYLDPGELRISTLFPGALSISGVSRNGVDSNTVSVETGYIESMETQTRRFPEGTYTVTLAYRNGYRETRTVDVLNNRSADLAFNYRPRLSMGNFSGTLPSFGVYIPELNPVNYQKIDTAAMQAMGMEPHYVRFLSGAKLFRDGDYDQALAEYTQAIGIKSDYAEAYNYRGYLYGERGDLEKAIADYSRAISLNAGYTDAYINRGYAYGERGDLDRAIADYTRAIELEPKNASAYNKRGSLYYQKGDDDRAIGDYNAAIKLKGDYTLAYNNRGNAWYSKGDLERAIADFDRAIALDRKFERAYVNRGNAWQKKGEAGRAGADFAAAEKLRIN